MDMDNEWAEELAKKGIKFREEKDRIIFYDPFEHGIDGGIQVREYDKNYPFGYLSKRIGFISKAEFDKLPKAVRYD